MSVLFAFIDASLERDPAEDFDPEKIAAGIVWPLAGRAALGPNIQIALMLRALPMTYRLLFFAELVRPRGPWDFKTTDEGAEPFGNWHFGFMGVLAGIPRPMLLRGAGVVQIATNLIRAYKGLPPVPSSGNPFNPWGAPFGDDYRDQRRIRQGIRDARGLIQNAK